MERLLVEFVLRSALIAAAAAVILRILRIRAAAAQHAVWTGVLAVMLLLPVWVQWGPKAALPLLPQQTTPAAAPAPFEATGPGSPASQEIPEPPPKFPVWSWSTIWIGVYLLGAGVLKERSACATRLR